MSATHHYILAHDTARKLAVAQVMMAPDGYHVMIKPPTRTLEQNARLWAMLGDIAEQVEWHGRELSSDEWKIVFSAALKKQDVIPGIDGGFVAIGQSTSRMSKRELSDLMELISAFGVDHNVVFHDEDAGLGTD